MPHVQNDVKYLLDLYSKCRANNQLPYSGGVLDQPAALMDLFEVIDEVKAEYRRKQATELQDG